MTASSVPTGVLAAAAGSGQGAVAAGIPSVWLVLLALACLLLSGLLSAGEAALARVTRSALDDAVEDAPQSEAVARERFRRSYDLVEDRHVALAAISFMRRGLDMTAAIAIALVLAAHLRQWWLVLLLGIAISLVLLGLVAGASPRTVGRRRPVAVLRALSPVITVVHRLVRPLVALWDRIRPASPLTDVEARAEMADDLREMVDSVVENDPFEEEDREWVRSVFELGQTLTREVMLPRTDMVTLETGTSLDDALALHVRSGFSRIPVIGETTDDLRGVLYVKDVVRRTHRHPDAARLAVEDVMRAPVFVPETVPVDDLLRDMQADAVHIAFAVDEYGGIAGLVTIEDLLEEIVGEMKDEHDRAEPEIEELTPATGDRHEGRVLRMPARTPIDEAGEAFDLEIEDDDVDTIGGLLSKALGRVPIVGATADVQGLHLVAERVEGRRRQVSALLVSRAPEPEDDDGETHGSSSAGRAGDPAAGDPAAGEAHDGAGAGSTAVAMGGAGADGAGVGGRGSHSATVTDGGAR